MKRIIVIGGVAGGASAAARARRINEDIEIFVFEKGPYISFANCGLPYHIGGIIPKRSSLLIQTPESFKARFNIDVFINTEVTKINAESKKITAKNLITGKEIEYEYDKLILSPGAEPFRPQIPGIDSDGIFNLWTMNDMDNVISYINLHNPKKAVVVGAGFIGLELAESLKHKGLQVSIIERDIQVMPPIDSEMAELLHQQLELQGVELKLGMSVNGFNKNKDGSITLKFEKGEDLVADIVVVAIGVRPRIALAKDAGLKIGETGAILVDEYLQTSDPNIFAVGDAVEVLNPISNKKTVIPLAGPANKQGRFSADNALGTKKIKYKGTIGSSVCKVFDLTVASTGMSEKHLRKLQKKK